MTSDEHDRLWSETLRSDQPTEAQFDELAAGVVEVYSHDRRFRQHIQNRFKRVVTRTGKNLDPANFDLDTARAFIADEIGFHSWDELIGNIEHQDDDDRPLL